MTNMDLQSLLEKKHISKYRLSKISGVPKTTIMDMCSGRSNIERCSAKTVLQLSRALGCTMEDIMNLSQTHDKEAGLPVDKTYLERGLPHFLVESISTMKSAWEKVDNGKEYLHWDCDYCNLQTDINNAEVNQVISPDQARYLRKKYLRME